MIFDTEIKNSVAVKIVPFKVKYNHETEATHITLKIVDDNLQSKCLFYYSLIDGNNTVLDSGNIEMTGDAYSSWDGSNIAAFAHALDVLHLSAKQ